MSGGDILKLCMVSIFINLVITMGFAMGNVGNAIDDGNNGYGSLLSWIYQRNDTLMTNYEVDTGLCEAQEVAGEDCSSDLVTETYDSTAFSIVDGMLNIPKFLVRLVKLAGMVILGKYALTSYLYGVGISSVPIYFILSLMLWLFDFAIFYNVLKLIFKKLGD